MIYNENHNYNYILEQYKQLPEDSLDNQVVRICCDYWGTKHVFTRCFWWAKENSQYSQQDIFNRWLENVLYLFYIRDSLNKWKEKKVCKLSTYVYRFIEYNEDAFTYQIKFDISLPNAFLLKRNVKKKDDSVLKYINTNSVIKSLDETIDNDDISSATLGELVEDPSIDVERAATAKKMYSDVCNFILNHPKITDKNKEMLMFYMHSDGSQTKTAKKFGVTKQRVDQLLRKTRKQLLAQGMSCTI